MENRRIFLYQSKGDQDTKGLRRSERSAGCWKSRFKLVGGSLREIREVIQLREVMRSPSGHKLTLIILPRKTSKEFSR